MALAADTIHLHRVSATVWVLAGGLTMFGMALGVAAEMKDYPGGSRALAASVEAGAEALRVLRWPAERLDTVGGYLTYHNVILINLLLAVYGAVLGVRAVRGDEERHALEEVLATGVSRSAVVRDRSAGFAALVVLICLGLGLSTAAGVAAAGEPDLGGSLVTFATCGLVAMVGYALGLLVSQLTGSGRAASGVSAVVLVALYVVSNLGEDLGPLHALRFLSPFHYANSSRALVPGYGLDVAGTAALLAMSAVLVALAAVAFERRDYAAPLWTRRVPRRAQDRHAGMVPTTLLGTVWTSILRRGRFGLLAWAAGGAAITTMMASLQPAVMEVWATMGFLGELGGGRPGVSIESAYWSFAGEMISPVISAFVLTQAATWVADLEQGRVEMILAGPVSWTRLVLERLVALLTGVAVITAASIGALVLVAAAVGATLDAAGLGRLAAGCVLLGAALGSVAAVVVAVVRRPVAVTVMAVVIGASYLHSYLVPLFDWPDWLNRLSVFWAFGHPYLGWPPASGLAVLVLLAGPGALLAAALAERTPKVA